MIYMLLETSTKLCIKALNDFYKLKDDEKLELVAIILEHWSKEQIFNNDKEVFLPYDVDFYNITSFSALCFLSAKILRKEESNLVINNDIEINTNITKGVNKCLSEFYKLKFNDKLHYIIELIIFICNQKYNNKNINKNITNEISVYDLIYNILDFKS